MGPTTLKIAGRNVIKDRRRSFAVFTAVVMSVCVLTFALGLLTGMRGMFLNLAFDTIGHICIQRQGYLEQSSSLPVHLLVDRPEPVVEALRSNSNVDSVTEELVFGGMILRDGASTEVTVRGIDTGDARWNTRYPQALKQGRLPRGAGELMIGAPTARFLKLAVGDTVDLMAYNVNGGVNAVRGVLAGTFETDRPDENQYLALIPLETARKLLQVDAGSTSVLVRLKNPDRLSETIAGLNARFSPAGLEAHSWKKVYAEVAVGLVWVNTILVLLFSIIVAVIVVGIINTHLISVFERIRVFGTMRSLGLSRKGLMGMVMAETGLLGVAGSLVGVILGAIAIRLVALNGIDMGPELDGIARIIYPAFSPEMGLFCFASGIAVSLGGALYPAHVASRLKPLEALSFQ